MRRFYRKPHGRAVPPPGIVLVGGRGHARAGGPRGGKLGRGDGSLPHVRPGGQRHRLGHSQAALPRATPFEVLEDRRSAVRTGPLRSEDGTGLVSLRPRPSRRASGPRRRGGSVQRRRKHEALRRQPPRGSGFLEARAAAGEAGERRKEVHLDREEVRRVYSTLAPEAFTTLPHFTISSWMKEPNCSGVQAVAIAPCCRSFSFMSA